MCYEGRFLFEAIPTKPLKQLANFETQCEMRVDMGCIDKQHKLIYIISYPTHLGQQLHYCLTYLSKLIYSKIYSIFHKMHKETMPPHMQWRTKTQSLYSKILKILSQYQMERLQQLIAPSSPRARWNESKMKRWERDEARKW